jgi:DNA-binding HxlR family transcriptional regulator
MPGRTDLSDTFCPVGRAAELLGDRAVLLILRDLFFGRRRFEAIATHTGLGPQLVSARLKLLVKEGVAERHAYQERPRRYEYRLTAKGKDLFDVLYAMRGWAERWAYAPGETGAGPRCAIPTGPAALTSERQPSAPVAVKCWAMGI